MYEHSIIAQNYDQSVLTALLKAVSPTPEQAAIDILEKFPSFQHATRAEKSDLAKIIGNTGADLLLTIPNAVNSMTREHILNAPNYLMSCEASKRHFAGILNGRRNEVFAVLYLNSKNRLIDEDVMEGGLDRITVYPREILRRAILLDASAILIAHNHPSGDTRPSDKDLRFTETLETMLDLIEVVLFDHLIFGEGEPYSMRQNEDI